MCMLPSSGAGAAETGIVGTVTADTIGFGFGACFFGTTASVFSAVVSSAFEASVFSDSAFEVSDCDTTAPIVAAGLGAVCAGTAVCVCGVLGSAPFLLKATAI